MKTLVAEDTKLVSGGDAIGDCSAAIGGMIIIVATDGGAALVGGAIATVGAGISCMQDLATSNPSDGSPTSYDGVDCSQLDYMAGA
jgi:hypothetical protein